MTRSPLSVCNAKAPSAFTETSEAATDAAPAYRPARAPQGDDPTVSRRTAWHDRKLASGTRLRACRARSPRDKSQRSRPTNASREGIVFRSIDG